MSKNNENNTSTKLSAGLVPKLRFPEFAKEESWKEISIDSIGNVVTGGTPSKEESEYWGGDFVWISAQDFKDKYIYDSILKLTKKGKEKSRVIPKNSVLVTCIASIGLNGINKVECATNQQINSIICNAANYFEFVYYAIINNIARLKNLAGQTAVPIINKSVFEKFTIPKPESTKEQQKIAACLSSLDEVITAESQKLDVLKEHKKGLLQNLFPCPNYDLNDEMNTMIENKKNHSQSKNQKNHSTDNVPKLRFKEFEESGEWVEKKLGEVAENAMYGLNAAAINFDGENKYIRITDIDEETRLFCPNPVTSPDKFDDKYLLGENDLLFARTGASVGKSYIHLKENGKVYFAGFLIRFKITDAIPYFIYLQTLTEQYKRWVTATSIRSGQPGINAEEYKSYTIYIPSKPEQQRIASTLSSLDDLITAQNQKIETLKQHKKGLLQGLFPKLSEL